MRIQQVHIYGFGKWIDYTIDFSTHSFICVYGENESGKSTLQKFILFMLFGLPPRKREFYRPKKSGKMGGRLTIDDSTIGTFIVERVDEVQNGAAKCYLNGQEYGEDWLKEQLKGLTEEIYHSIYTFSTLDLINITDMKDEDLGDILLGIGLTGSSNIYSIERELDKKIGELFKPFGKKPLINKQLETVDKLQVDLKKLKNNELTYREKQNQTTNLKKKLEQLQQKLEKTTESLLSIEKQQHALPLIHDYQNNIDQLNNYPEMIDFPENGIERLQLLKEQLLPFKSEYFILKNNLQKNKKTHKKLKKALIDEEMYKMAEDIYRQKQPYIDNQKQMDQLQQTINELDLQINATLKELNIGLDRKKLSKIRFPFYTEQNWNEFKNNVERLKLEKEQLQNEHHSLKKKQSLLKNEWTQIEAECLDDHKMEEIQQKINNYTTQDYLTNQQQKKWEKTYENKKRKNNNLLIGSLIFSLLMTSIGYFFDLQFLYNITVLIFVIGLSQWFIGKNSLKEIQVLVRNSEPNDSIMTMQEKHESEQVLLRQAELKTEISTIQQQLKSLDIQLIQWGEKSSLIKQQEFRLHEQIEEQYNHYSFLRHIEIKYWPELYHSLKNLMKKNNEHEGYVNQLKQLKKNQAIIQQSLYQLLDKLNINFHQKSTTELFEVIHKIIQTQKNKQIEIAQFNKQMSEIRDQKLKLTEKINIYEQEIDELFSIAKVKTEEDFHLKAKQLKEKQTLELKVKKLREQLQLTFSDDTWQKNVENKLTETDLDLLKQRKKLEMKALEDQIEKIRQKQSDLNASLLNLESSESFSTTMHQFYMEKEQLNKLTIEWAILKTAKEMLDHTKKSYRNKYLAKVISRTSDYFNHITEGAYQKIYAPDENHQFRVEANDGLLYKVNELSRGTIDQLYVSLRIAISDIMNSNHHLPFIIDDAFLNFDSIRLKRMFDRLKELSKNQQIILFTCRQELFDHHDALHIIYLNSTTRIH